MNTFKAQYAEFLKQHPLDTLPPVEGVSDRALMWLALAPAWPLDIAVLGSPVQKESWSKKGRSSRFWKRQKRPG